MNQGCARHPHLCLAVLHRTALGQDAATAAEPVHIALFRGYAMVLFQGQLSGYNTTHLAKRAPRLAAQLPQVKLPQGSTPWLLAASGPGKVSADIANALVVDLPGAGGLTVYEALLPYERPASSSDFGWMRVPVYVVLL